MLCAAAAGISARIICHPLDTIKTVAFTGFAHEPAAAATAGASASSSSNTYSFAQTARKIWRAEGAAGFYRGLGVAAIGSAPGVALYLSTYDYVSHAWVALGQGKHPYHHDAAAMPTWLGALTCLAAHTPAGVTAFVSGLLAEAVSCLVWVPIDVSKERLQSQPPSVEGRYRNSGDALRRIYKLEGLRGWYRGYWSTLASFGPFSAVYFVFYELLSKQLKRLAADRHYRLEDPSTAFVVALVAGAGGNVIASLCTNPLELVKTRLQVQRAVLHSSATNNNHAMFHYNYQGLRQGLSAVLKEDGARGLWRGVGSRMAFTAPNAALTMAFYGLLKERLL